jgi:hypothetical protein
MKLRLDPMTTLRFVCEEEDSYGEILLIHSDSGKLYPEEAAVVDRGRVLVFSKADKIFEEVRVMAVIGGGENTQINVAFVSDRDHGFTMLRRPGGILAFDGHDYQSRRLSLLMEIEVKLIG